MVALILPGAASAQSNTFEIGSTAELGPEGASLNLPVTINCDPGFDGSTFFEIRQAQGKRLIDGTGFAPVTCDGLDHTVIALIRA